MCLCLFFFLQIIKSFMQRGSDVEDWQGTCVRACVRKKNAVSNVDATMHTPATRVPTTRVPSEGAQLKRNNNQNNNHIFTENLTFIFILGLFPVHILFYHSIVLVLMLLVFWATSGKILSSNKFYPILSSFFLSKYNHHVIMYHVTIKIKKIKKHYVGISGLPPLTQPQV